MKTKLRSFLGSKPFRYGAASVVLTAVIVALVILLNVVFTLLASNLNWYADMTEEKLYTVSETTKTLLDEVFEPDENGETQFTGKMSILFMQEEDKIESATDAQGRLLKQVYALARAYEKEYRSKIEVRCIDMFAHPGDLMKYTGRGTALSAYSVVFDSNAGPYQAVAFRNFFYYGNGTSSEPTAFYGEHRITASILSVCGKQYIAYNTVGHGEDPIFDAFSMALQAAGYTVKDVNLQQMSFVELRDEVKADRPRLVIVNNPKTEFVATSEGSELNEIGKLERILSGAFLDEKPLNSFTSLFVIADPSKGCENRNLNQILDKWGLRVHSGSADQVTENIANAISTDGTAFLATYSGDELFAALTSKLSAGGNFRVAVNGAGTVDYKDLGSSDLSTVNGSVLNLSDGRSVLAASQRQNIVGQAIKKYNYAIVAADASIVSDEYLMSASYANEGVINNMIRMTTVDKEATPKVVLVDKYKDYIPETNVTDVSVGGKQAFLIVMAGVLPALMLTVGIVIYVKRRNRI